MTDTPMPSPVRALTLDPIGPLQWLVELARWLEHAAFIWIARWLVPNDMPRWERERRRRVILRRSDIPAWLPWHRWRLVVIGNDSALWAFAQDRRVITLTSDRR